MKFNTGDNVRVKTTDPAYKSLHGEEATVNRIYPTSYEIKINNGKYKGMYFNVDDSELELVNSPSIISLPPGMIISSDWDKYYPSIISSGAAIQYMNDNSKSHSCTWKTYTGLMYKEEYCDCGATKNKRGIYE